MQLRFFAVLTCCVVLGAGCAVQKVAFQASPLQPAADAMVKVRIDRNQNTLVELKLKHVAPAEMLWPPKSVYVVWAEDTEGGLIQLGQLRVNKRREASFKGTTALERFRVVITAEDEPRPEEPSQPHMLATEFFSARKIRWLR